MKAFRFVILLSLLSFWGSFVHAQKNSAASTASQPESFESFVGRVRALAENPKYSAAMLGVKVESLDTGKLVFEQNANKLLKPASNNKMYTGSLALDRLGPDYKIRTSFYAQAHPDSSGVLKGDLLVYGRGDPSFSHRFNDGNYDKAIQQLADAVTGAGIKKITGDLIGDDSYFRCPPYGDGWSWNDLQQYYGAEASALSLQENTVDLVFKPGEKVDEPLKIVTKPATTYLTFVNRTTTVAKGGKRKIKLYRPIDQNVVYVWGSLPMGDAGYDDSVAVQNAPLWFITTLRDALAKRGVEISGKLRTIGWLEREADPLDTTKLTELAYIDSHPVSEIVKNMMKPSQNLYAHLLLLQVGEKSRKPGDTTQTDNLGLAEMRKFLSEAGVARGDALLEEGSGLSRGTLLKPSASVALLKYMSKHRYASIFRDALPLAGVDGTLKKRFHGTAAQNNLRAKTGSLEYVNTLSGYVTTKGKENLVFSIMMNAYSGDGRAEIDKIATMLAEFNGRTDR